MHVSEISFGCMSLAENDPGNARLLQHAVELGINFFDTADLYQHGNNEIIVGKALKERRKEIFIATKVGNQWRSDGSGWDWNPGKDYILASADKSLQRLQTDYIDLYQLHGGTIEDKTEETIEAFELLKQQGKIRYYGISSIRPNVIRTYAEKSTIVSVMMQYSLLDRRLEENCLDLLQRKQISILARGALAKGLLVNKDAIPYLNYQAEEVGKAAAAVAALSNSERNETQTALAFVLAQSSIASAVVGIRTIEQLEDVVQATFSPRLTETEIKLLAKSIPINYYEQHR